MNYPNCNCNVCGVRMHHDEPKSRDKYCGLGCKAIDKIRHKDNFGMQFDPDFRKASSGRRSVLDCQQWPNNGK
jgi:hypothetical protein